MPDSAHGAGKLGAGCVAVLVGKSADPRAVGDPGMGTAKQHERYAKGDQVTHNGKTWKAWRTTTYGNRGAIGTESLWKEVA